MTGAVVPPGFLARATTPTALVAAGILAAGVVAPGAFAAGADPLEAAPGVGGPSPTRSAGPSPADTLWDSPRVRTLVAEVASERRSLARGERALEGYRARADAHVYYLFDPGDLPAVGAMGPRIARADQVALRLQWGGPGSWRQRIVGRRSRTFLPVDLHYHTDHLGVVMENFGRAIRMGEGTEVRGVLHPAAPGADSLYQYRLADSLSVAVGGETRRLYRVEFRPRRPDAAAAVGSLFLDATGPAVARMRFSFTPEAYRDPQIQEITVDLQSALVEGRIWLPAEQETTIRRRLRWLDFPAGGTIHTRVRIYGYELNPDPPVAVGGGGRITTGPEEEVRAYDAWDSPLVAEGEGRRPPEDLDAAEIQARAREIMARRRLGGTEPLRLHLPDGSQALRLRRAEGLLLGSGGLYESLAGRWAAWAGYPFGRDRPEASLSWSWPPAADPGWRLEVAGCLNCLRDVGPFPAASGAVSSAWALLDGEDFTDPYFQSSAGISASWPSGRAGRVSVGLTYREVTAASLGDGPWGDGEARPVRPVVGGSGAVLHAALSRPVGRALGTRWRLELSAEGASSEAGDFDYGRMLARLGGEGRTAGGAVTWRAEAALGAATGSLPSHRLFLLGGRGTLPGHPFRRWGGSRVALSRAEVTAGVLPPWLSVRGLASAGWAEPGSPGRKAARRFGVGPSDGIQTSAGAGVALFWDLLRLDLTRGLGDGGEWEWQLSVEPGFWPIL